MDNLNFAGQRVLITGASGFLGSHLCRRLQRTGAEIHGVSRTARSSECSFMRWWEVNLTDSAAVRRFFTELKPDLIFHFSGVVTATPDLELVLPTFHSLLASSVNILTAASETECHRVVLTGSLTEPKPGDNESTPASPYAAAKWASSAYARMFHQLFGTPVVIVRPFMTFGPGQDPRKLIPYVTLSLLKGEPPKLSSGQTAIDWIYIDDVICGLLAAAQVPDVRGCTIDLGSGNLVSIRTVVKHLVELTASKTTPMFGTLPDRPHEQERSADIASAYAKLAWKPKTALLDGLTRTVSWYREQYAAGLL
jgi:UDP-glucose 4-epimerase